MLKISVEAWSEVSAGVSLSWVATSSVETSLPHEEQKRASGGTCVPQELQRVIASQPTKEQTEVYVKGPKMGNSKLLTS